MAEHFTSDDVEGWEGTVQGNADAVEPSPEVAAPDVPEDVAAKAGEWAGTAQGNPDGAAEAEADS